MILWRCGHHRAGDHTNGPGMLNYARLNYNQIGQVGLIALVAHSGLNLRFGLYS